ncbi:hypothetical protein HDU83_005338 [Entophlyctis luteolus]|nr:hypothetical protein HDU83_005338 [Entophlyctis luteolus]
MSVSLSEKTPPVPPRSCSAALDDLMRALGDELAFATVPQPSADLNGRLLDTPSSDASAIDRPMIAGTLLKLDSISGEWKPRHFELVGDQLAMFKSRNSGSPIAVLPVSRCRGFYNADADAWMLRVSGFSIWSDGASHKRIWTLKCPDAQVMRFWANAVKVATTAALPMGESFLSFDDGSLQSRSRSSPALTSVGSHMSTRSYDDDWMPSSLNRPLSPTVRKFTSPSPSPSPAAQFERNVSPTNPRAGSLSPTNEFQSINQKQHHPLQQQLYRTNSPSSRLASDSTAMATFYEASLHASSHDDDILFADSDRDNLQNLAVPKTKSTAQRHISGDYSSMVSMRQGYVKASAAAYSPLRRSQSLGPRPLENSYPDLVPGNNQKKADFNDESFSHLSSVRPEEIEPAKKNWFRFLRKK